MLRLGMCSTVKEAKAKADARTRCNAKTCKGTLCRCRGLGRGGRCKFHGGASPGPKTSEGKARSLAAAHEGLRLGGKANSAPLK